MLAELAMRWSTDEQLVDKLACERANFGSKILRDVAIFGSSSCALDHSSVSQPSSRNHAQLFLKKPSHPPIVFVKVQKANARY